jgi:cytochrome c oxidase assembly protein subunit 19
VVPSFLNKKPFPQDHDGECKKLQIEYMNCLKNNNFVATLCREASKSYLECRMQNDLMFEEGMEKLGFDPKSTERVDEFNDRLSKGELKAKKSVFGNTL